ncbi:MAG TPA: hypothetical protein PLE74_06655 [Candidatus Cloacimonadota bacterium]|nr:hypothetical protein [Candidatus Cloacimonadota bacterium]
MIDINQLPRISRGGNSISLIDLLDLAMWIKVLKHYKIILNSLFGKNLIMVFFVLVIAVAFNAIITGIDVKMAIYFIRAYSYYICYFYVLLFVKDSTDFTFILKITFFISCLVLANQISLVFSGKELNTILFGHEQVYQTEGAMFTRYTGDYLSDKSRGIMYDGQDPLLLLICSLTLFGLYRDRILRNMMITSIIFVIMSGLIEATRSYIVFISLPLIAFMRNVKNMFHMSRILLTTVILMLVVFIIIGGFGYAYFHDIFLRLSGLIKFINSNTRGDVETAIGRLNAAKIMIDVIVQSPLIGHGFSQEAQATDNDLGFLNTIILTGFIGLLVFIYIIFKYFSICLSILRRIAVHNPFRISIYVLLYAMVGIFIGYSTIQDFFSSSNQNIAFISIFLGFSEIIFFKALDYEKNFQHADK